MESVPMDLFGSILRKSHFQCVEEGLATHVEHQPLQSSRQRRGEAVDPAGDRDQTLWPMIDGVHARQNRGKHLRGADVAGGAVSPDVLFARLERQAVRQSPLRLL